MPLGLLCLAAIKWPGWRMPTLAFATAHYLLHTVSHVIDIGNATPRWAGVLDFVVMAVGLMVHAIALWFAVAVCRQHPSRCITRP